MINLDRDFALQVSKTVQLELLKDEHADELFCLITENRSYLRKWLPWVDRMRSLSQFREFIKDSNKRVGGGLEIGCVIRDQKQLAGRAGIYNIDREKGTATLGYWIAEQHQGRGLITNSCWVLIDYAFNALQLNDVEIRCATNNHKSMAIAERLNFCRSGIIKNGEFFNQRFIDLYVYSLSKKEWNKLQQKEISKNSTENI